MSDLSYFYQLIREISNSHAMKIRALLSRFRHFGQFIGKPLTRVTVKSQHVNRWHVAGFETVKFTTIGESRIPTDGKVATLPAIDRVGAARQQGVSGHKAPSIGLIDALLTEAVGWGHF